MLIASAVGVLGVAAVVGLALARAAPPTVYTCPYCGETFDTYEALVAHIQEVHPGEEIPPAFTGFSLMIENPVAGAAYWLADFPYSAYTGKTDLLPVDRAGWITQEAPGMDYIRIQFVDSNYQCPEGDPNCEGLIFYCFFEDGHHYILDCATGELRENPSPPIPPEEPLPDEPQILDVDIPAVQSGAGFDIAATAFLPKPLGAHQSWFVSFRTGGSGNDDPASTLGMTQFLAPEVHSQITDPALAEQFIPLDAANHEYSFITEALAVYLASQNNLVPLPPGSYPVKVIAQYSHASWYPGEGQGLGFTLPQKTFDLGEVGVLEVV